MTLGRLKRARVILGRCDIVAKLLSRRAYSGISSESARPTRQVPIARAGCLVELPHGDQRAGAEQKCRRLIGAARERGVAGFHDVGMLLRRFEDPRSLEMDGGDVGAAREFEAQGLVVIPEGSPCSRRGRAPTPRPAR